MNIKAEALGLPPTWDLSVHLLAIFRHGDLDPGRVGLPGPRPLALVIPIGVVLHIGAVVQGGKLHRLEADGGYGVKDGAQRQKTHSS